MNLLLSVPAHLVDTVSSALPVEELSMIIDDAAAAIFTGTTACFQSTFVFLESILIVYEEKTGDVHPIDSLFSELRSIVDSKTFLTPQSTIDRGFESPYVGGS